MSAWQPLGVHGGRGSHHSSWTGISGRCAGKTKQRGLEGLRSFQPRPEAPCTGDGCILSAALSLGTLSRGSDPRGSCGEPNQCHSHNDPTLNDVPFHVVQWATQHMNPSFLQNISTGLYGMPCRITLKRSLSRTAASSSTETNCPPRSPAPGDKFGPLLALLHTLQRLIESGSEPSQGEVGLNHLRPVLPTSPSSP